VTLTGGLWLLASHRILCGDSIDDASFVSLLESEKASAVFTGPPYNVKIDGHVGGKRSITHREFAMAAGEMTEPEFTKFLAAALDSMCSYAKLGALIYSTQCRRAERNGRQVSSDGATHNRPGDCQVNSGIDGWNWNSRLAT
jgi:DNA modification methylase